MELEGQLDAAMRSRRAARSWTDTETASAQLQTLELHNTNLEVPMYTCCILSFSLGLCCVCVIKHCACAECVVLYCIYCVFWTASCHSVAC